MSTGPLIAAPNALVSPLSRRRDTAVTTAVNVVYHAAFRPSASSRGARPKRRVSGPVRVREGLRSTRTRANRMDTGQHDRPGQRFRASTQASGDGLHVEANFQDVAVDDFVVLALDAELALLLGLRPRAEPAEVVPVDHLGSHD